MVPVVPVIDGYYAPKVIGRANDDCYLDDGCIAEALLASRERYGYDGILAEMGLGEKPNILGCTVEVEGNDVPLVVDTLVSDRDDLERVKAPDPWSGGKMEPVERLVADSAGEYAVLGSVRSPFEYAATIRGLAEFMTDFYRDPEFVHQLTAATRHATLVTAAALIAAGVDALVIKDSFASSSMISPDHYREFAYPSEAAVIGEIKDQVPVILHICRNSTPILPLMAETGAAALEVDSPVDMASAREAVGGEIVLKGNIDAVRVMEKGTVADVEAAVCGAMEAAKEGGRFILSSGDSIPKGTPEENIRALVEYGRKYGRY
jgi:MtaA/CmuA family methyltransferase